MLLAICSTFYQYFANTETIGCCLNGIGSTVDGIATDKDFRIAGYCL